jgi:hypothetical protein
MGGAFSLAHTKALSAVERVTLYEKSLFIE